VPGLEPGTQAPGGQLVEAPEPAVDEQGARGDLLAGDEAVVEPAQRGGGRDPEFASDLGHVEQLSFGHLFAGLVAADVPVVAQ